MMIELLVIFGILVAWETLKMFISGGIKLPRRNKSGGSSGSGYTHYPNEQRQPFWNQSSNDEPMFKNDYKEDDRPFYEQDPMKNIFRGDVFSEPLDFSNPNNNYLIDSFDPNKDETNQTPPY